jgi:hypothetical protein
MKKRACYKRLTHIAAVSGNILASTKSGSVLLACAHGKLRSCVLVLLGFSSSLKVQLTGDSKVQDLHMTKFQNVL